MSNTPSSTHTVVTPDESSDKLTISILGIALRFLSCGILALGIGILWRYTIAPSHLTIGDALVGVFSLLVGFIVGGIIWYVVDRKRKQDEPTRTFSLVVFVIVPILVLALVLVIWLLSLFLGNV
ncbi:MAG: hypothetical protein ACP5OR_04640 [Candidatus Dormibacteria bacterium]